MLSQSQPSSQLQPQQQQQQQSNHQDPLLSPMTQFLDAMMMESTLGQVPTLVVTEPSSPPLETSDSNAYLDADGFVKPKQQQQQQQRKSTGLTVVTSFQNTTNHSSKKRGGPLSAGKPSPTTLLFAQFLASPTTAATSPVGLFAKSPRSARPRSYGAYHKGKQPSPNTTMPPPLPQPLQALQQPQPLLEVAPSPGIYASPNGSVYRKLYSPGVLGAESKLMRKLQLKRAHDAIKSPINAKPSVVTASSSSSSLVRVGKMKKPAPMPVISENMEPLFGGTLNNFGFPAAAAASEPPAPNKGTAPAAADTDDLVRQLQTLAASTQLDQFGAAPDFGPIGAGLAVHSNSNGSFPLSLQFGGDSVGGANFGFGVGDSTVSVDPLGVGTTNFDLFANALNTFGDNPILFGGLDTNACLPSAGTSEFLNIFASTQSAAGTAAMLSNNQQPTGRPASQLSQQPPQRQPPHQHEALRHPLAQHQHLPQQQDSSQDGNTKAFPCPYQPDCQHSFSRRHDLLRHLRIHNNEKPYRCDRCFKAFTRLDALNRHVKISEKYGGQCRNKRGRVPKANGNGNMHLMQSDWALDPSQ